MAENKKSFILYCDLIHTVSKMPNENAGELFKHILEYVNDKDPVTDDLIIQLTFEPIKQQLKRDLVKWVEFVKKQAENGKKGGRPKTQTNPNKGLGYLDNPTEPKKAVNVNDTVNVSVNEKEKNNPVGIVEKKFIPAGPFASLYEKMMETWIVHFKTYFKDDKVDYPACNHIARNVEILKVWEKGACMNGKMDEFLEYWNLMAEKASKHSWLSQFPLTELSKQQWQKWCTHMSNQEKGISSKDAKPKKEEKEKPILNLQNLASRYD